MTEKELFQLNIEEPDHDIYARAKARFDSLAKPIDGFGDLEDVICRIAAIHRKEIPDISKKSVIVMFADSRVVESGVSQTGSDVTRDVAGLTGEGRSTLCVMTSGYPIEVIGVDIGMDHDGDIPGIVNMKVARGAGNIEKEPAMTREECLSAIENGIRIVERCAKSGTGLIATGEMGIGNTTTATALLCALTGDDPKTITGRGAGLSDEGLARKRSVIVNALNLHGYNKYDKNASGVPGRTYAFDALSRVGGLDIAGLCGAFIGGGIYHVPVVIDGLISAVAALAASYIVPGCERYMVASHKGREKGCESSLSRLGLKSLIDADMALGEGTGAVMIIPVIDMVYRVYNSGTSFETAQIQQYRRYDN